MIFSYNNLAQPDGAVAITIAAPQITRDERGNLEKARIVWNITGEIIRDTQAEITTALAQLEQFYNRDGGDAILYLDNGTRSYHQLLSRDTLGGVRSGFVYYPDGQGVEYVNGRKWALELSAEIGRGSAAGNSLMSFVETLQITGDGGPRYVVRESRNTKPIRQQVSVSTPVRASQSGQAVGYGSYPPAPPPIWPQWLVNPESAISKGSPAQSGNGGASALTTYQISWNYVYESPVPLSGNPTQRSK